MTIPADVLTRIDSPEDLRARVDRNSKLARYGTVFLAIAGLLLARNILVTFASLDKNPGASFAELMFVTTDETGENSGGLVAMTYGPFLAAPIGLVLLLMAALTARSWAARTYDAYSRSGWIAEQVPTGLRVSGRRGGELVVLTDGSLSREAAEEAVALLRSRLATLTGMQVNQLTEKLIAVGRKIGRVGDLVPEFPPASRLAIRTADGRPLVMIGGSDAAKPRVLTLKG